MVEYSPESGVSSTGSFGYSETRFEALLKEASEQFEWSSVLQDVGISKYRDLGAQYEMTCPFHEDKRPSFRVDVTRKTFHCFSCGRHGSIVKFMYLMSGSSGSYKSYCENLLRSNKNLQRKLGVTTLRVRSNEIAKDFEHGRRFDRAKAITSSTTVGALYQKIKRYSEVDGDNGSDRLWSNMVMSLSLLQRGLDPSTIADIIAKNNGISARGGDSKGVVKTKGEKISLLDLFTK